MALIRCKECGKEISDQAESCPNCGYKIKKQTQEVIIKKGNTARTGTIMSIVASSIELAYIALLLLGIIFSEKAGKLPIENNTDFWTYFLMRMCCYISIVVSIATIIEGVNYLKNKIKREKYTLYGINMLIYSIMMLPSMILMLNCCAIFLCVVPIISFIGSIMILVGNVKEKQNENTTNN